MVEQGLEKKTLPRALCEEEPGISKNSGVQGGRRGPTGKKEPPGIYVPGNRLPPAASLRTGEGRPGSGGGDAASQGGVFPLPTRHKRPNAVALTVHEPASSHQSIYSTRHWARHEKRRLPWFLLFLMFPRLALFSSVSLLPRSL